MRLLVPAERSMNTKSGIGKAEFEKTFSVHRPKKKLFELFIQEDFTKWREGDCSTDRLPRYVSNCK